jgi:hypothetical protein
LLACLVAHHHAVELVGQCVDGGIEVEVRGFDKQVLALDAQRAAGALALLLLLLVVNCQQELDNHHQVKFPNKAL